MERVYSAIFNSTGSLLSQAQNDRGKRKATTKGGRRHSPSPSRRRDSKRRQDEEEAIEADKSSASSSISPHGDEKLKGSLRRRQSPSASRLRTRTSPETLQRLTEEVLERQRSNEEEEEEEGEDNLLHDVQEKSKRIVRQRKDRSGAKDEEDGEEDASTMAQQAEKMAFLSHSLPPSSSGSSLSVIPSSTAVSGDISPKKSKVYVRSIRKLLLEIRNALFYGGRAYTFAYVTKGLTTFLMFARKKDAFKNGGINNAIRILFHWDTMRFALFSGALVGGYKLLHSILRFIRGKDSATVRFIAGWLSGLTLMLDAKGRRETISLYILIRALDVLGRYWTKLQIIPPWEYWTEFLFGVINAFVMYGFLFEPHLLDKGYYKWILQTGAMSHHGLEAAVRVRWRLGHRDRQFVGCQPHYHM